MFLDRTHGMPNNNRRILGALLEAFREKKISCNIHFAKLLPGEYFFSLFVILSSAAIILFLSKKVEGQGFDIIVPLFIGLAIIYLTMNH